ncbi:porin, partial [Flavobacteriaceae bacterium]|nr:porin [Flavobacteriaceae bacterium]
MRAIKLILFTILLSTTSLYGQEVTASKFGKGLLNIQAKDSTFSMNISARMQYLTSTSWSESDDSFGSPESNFLIRRARLKFKGFAYSPKL